MKIRVHQNSGNSKIQLAFVRAGDWEERGLMHGGFAPNLQPRVAKIAILRQNIPISAGVESHRRNRPKGLPPREAKTAILQQTKPIRVGTNGDLPPRVAKAPCFGGKNSDPLTKQPHQCRGGRLWGLSHSPQENIGRML